MQFAHQQPRADWLRTASFIAMTQKSLRMGCPAWKARSTCAVSGWSRLSPVRDGLRQNVLPKLVCCSNRCLATETTWDYLPSRPALAARRLAIFRRHSPTWRSSAPPSIWIGRWAVEENDTLRSFNQLSIFGFCRKEPARLHCLANVRG